MSAQNPDPHDAILLPPEPQQDARGRRRPRDRRRRRWPWIVILAVVVLLLAAIAVYGVLMAQRAFAVKDELTAAQKLVPAAADAAKALDIEGAQKALADVAEHTGAAVTMTSDPLWNVGEVLPWVGASLHAVAEIAAVTDDTVRAAQPVLEIAPSLLPQNLVPVDGAFPVARLVEAAPVVRAFTSEVAASQKRLAAVDVAGTPDMVGEAKTKLTAALGQADDMLATADTLLQVVPELLGANGERKYLLVFQNNAESVVLGGSAASQTLISADNGALKVLAQAGSGDFDNGNPVDVPIADSAKVLYGGRFGSYVNLLPSQPDWPNAAAQAKAFWQRDIRDDELAGVASIDPLALQRILGATGPITVDGHKLDEKNAVKVLLHDSYTWWPASELGDKTDAFFADVAAAVFGRVASGGFDFDKMIAAVNDSIDTGSIMYWTDDADVSALLAGAPVLGVLPTDNVDSTTVGVYFRDTSASKIDYFVDTTADVSSTCSDGTMTVTATASVTYSATQSDLSGLPRYITGAWLGQKIRTQVFIYAPPGMTIQSVSVDGREVRPFRQGQVDLGRAVAPFEMYERPGETASVTAVFTGEGEFGPLALKNTPMIRPTKTTVTDGCAG